MRLNLSDEAQLAIEQLDELRRMRPEPNWKARHPPLLPTCTRTSSTTIATKPAQSCARSAGCTATGGPAAHSTAISSSRTPNACNGRFTLPESYVPQELDAAAGTVEQITRLVNRATNDKTHRVQIINLRQRPDLAPFFAGVREELEQAVRDAEQAAEAAAS